MDVTQGAEKRERHIDLKKKIRLDIYYINTNII